MALSPLSTRLFSWSHVTYNITELTVTPLEEGCRQEEEGRETTAQTKCGQAKQHH